MSLAWIAQQLLAAPTPKPPKVRAKVERRPLATTESRVLAALHAAYPAPSHQQVADALGVSRRTVERALIRLSQQGASLPVRRCEECGSPMHAVPHGGRQKFHPGCARLRRNRAEVARRAEDRRAEPPRPCKLCGEYLSPDEPRSRIKHAACAAAQDQARWAILRAKR